jgi:hypothetical protein
MSTTRGYPRRKAARRRDCKACGYPYPIGHYRKHLADSAWHRARRRHRKH